VHGGGKQLTQTLKLMGKESSSSRAARDRCGDARCRAEVLVWACEQVAVAALRTHGVSAMGLAGGDGNVFRARKKEDRAGPWLRGRDCRDRPAVARSHLEMDAVR